MEIKYKKTKGHPVGDNNLPNLDHKEKEDDLREGPLQGLH